MVWYKQRRGMGRVLHKVLCGTPMEAYGEESWGSGWSSCLFLSYTTPLNRLGKDKSGIESLDDGEELVDELEKIVTFMTIHI